MKLLIPYAVIVLVAIAAYGAVLINGSGFSHPDDIFASRLQCCGFRPLLALSYQLNIVIGGWMILNVFLHVMAGWLLYRLSGSLWGACLFVAHPMAADAVASVAGRSALLLAVSVLCAVGATRRWRWIFIAALIGTAGFVPSYFGTILNAPNFLDHLWRYMGALASYVLPRLFLPLHLSADPLITPSLIWTALGIVIIGLSMGLIISLRGTPWAAGLALLILPLLPYAFVALPDVFLEHRAYLAIAGASLLLARVLRNTKVARYAVVGLFIILSNVRADVYSSQLKLWEDAAWKSPMSARAHLNLGSSYAQAYRLTEAESEFRWAIALNPDMGMAWQNLSVLQAVRGNIGEASRILDAQLAHQQSKLHQ